ncbi:MAG: 50S ribosomal protein L3 [Magnetococcales bacterium]|nr:50S ribosomal protein L3 [Magnetococcales bacterium]
MRTGLIGRKLGMTQMFMPDGKRVPVTLLQVGPCAVVAKRVEEKDGYTAIQVGFEEMKPSRVAKPIKGHYAKASVTPRRILKEFRVSDLESYQIGQELTVALFQVNGYVDVTSKSVGKGFAGTMKRYGFAGGNASHGAKKIHRSGGSIGQCQSPGRVFPGKKMAGQMGNENVTMQNLRITVVDAERNLLAVKGSVPGSKGTMVLIRDAVKKPEVNG